MRSMVQRGGPSFGAPRWMGDYSGRDNLMIGGFRLDAAQFAADDAFDVTLNDVAGAAAGDESITVDALTGALPFGTRLEFAGGTYAIVNGPAPAGATAIPVRPLLGGIADGEAATYAGTGNKYVPSGTAVGRTIAERDAGTGFGPAGDADDEVFLTAFDVDDAADIDDVELYRPNNTVYENFLPNFAGMSAAVKAKLRASYRCTINTPEA